MSPSSREAIRTRLRQSAQQVDQAVTRVTQRFIPVGDVASDPPPDHEAYIRVDYSLCCAYHEAHIFREVRS